MECWRWAVRRRKRERAEGCWGSVGACPEVKEDSCWEGCRWGTKSDCCSVGSKKEEEEILSG